MNHDHPAREVDEINGKTRAFFRGLMSSTKIQNASLACVRRNDCEKISLFDKSSEFQVASLSKPVFAYLVLKIMAAKQAKTPFDLQTPLYSVYRDKNNEILPDDSNPFLMKFLPEQREFAKQLTAETVLAHRTGLHIVAKEPYEFQFKPGEYYAYSGPGIDCLESAVKTVTGKDLESLAQEFIFGSNALNMKATYGREPVAANSLQISAEDYARLITTWIQDEKLNFAFRPTAPVFSMHQDFFPQSTDKLVEKIDLQDSDRAQVTWGLGVGLVTNEQGEVIGAYHTGDMNEWRAGFAAEIDPKTKQCLSTTVYCAQGVNGHLLAEPAFPPSCKPALNYFFPTYGFARKPEELEGTDFFGMNPKLLKPSLREAAEKTKSVTHQYKEQLQSAKSENQEDQPSPDDKFNP